MTIFQYAPHKIQPVTLTIKLGSGGEGTVYAVEGNPDICVKIYHEQKRTPELEAKLKAMIDAPPKDPTLAAGHYSICWPTNVVYEDEACTKFLGFTMPRIDRNVFKEYHLLCDKPGVTTSTCYRLEHFGTGFTYLHMYVVALNLASCVASIHNAGHAIGDLNDKNILVSTKDSKITIVDCDSFEIHAQDDKIFTCSVYMPEYSAPEVILHKDIKNRQESDRFALSVLIFKLLMLNTHPYASRGSSVEHLNTPGEKIASGYYPYEEYSDLDVNPPAYALPYEIISPNIKALFRRCFVEGQHEPEKRPTAIEWFVAIKENYEAMIGKVQNKLVMCGNNARHFFPTHLTTCPWCAMKEDYFPTIYNKIDKTTQTQSLDVFDYITQMLEVFMKDNYLSIIEEKELLRELKKSNLTEKDLNKIYSNYERQHPGILIGSKPYYSTKIIKFGTMYQTDAPKDFSFFIRNNYTVSDIIVSLQSNHPTVDITPSTATIKPGNSSDFTVTIDPMKMQNAANNLCENLQIIVKESTLAVKKNVIISIIADIIEEQGFWLLLSELFSIRQNLLILSLINYLIAMIILTKQISQKTSVFYFIVSIFSFIVFLIPKTHKLLTRFGWYRDDGGEIGCLFIVSFLSFPFILYSFRNYLFSLPVSLLFSITFLIFSLISIWLFHRKKSDMRTNLKNFIFLLIYYFFTSWIMLIFV